MEKIEINENEFKTSAKEITDMLFDKRLFVDSLTRDDMNAFENLLNCILQGKFEMHIRAHELLKRLEKNKPKPTNTNQPPIRRD